MDTESQILVKTRLKEVQILNKIECFLGLSWISLL